MPTSVVLTIAFTDERDIVETAMALKDHLLDTFNDDDSIHGIGWVSPRDKGSVVDGELLCPNGHALLNDSTEDAPVDRVYTQFNHWEDVGAKRSCSYFDGAELHIEGRIEDYDLENGHDEYFMCMECDAEFDLPAGIPIVWS